MKTYPYPFLSLILITLASLFPCYTFAENIDAKLSDSANASSFQIKNSNDSVLMKVQSGGNVGIGTTSPGQKLSVVGTVESTSGGFKFPDGTTQTTAVSGGGDASYGSSASSPTDAVYVNDSGNVGIGTTVPAARLEVNQDDQSNNNPTLKIVGRNSSWSGYSRGVEIKAGFDANDYSLKIQSTKSDLSTRDVLYVRGNGNVGIGTTNPQYTLDVIGDIRATGSIYYGGSSGGSGTGPYIKPDYVFQEDYKKMSTEEVAGYLEKEGHLPWLTSLKREKEENGEMIDMTRMAFETVETVENLQLQIVALSEIVKAQQKQIKQLLTILSKSE